MTSLSESWIETVVGQVDDKVDHHVHESDPENDGLYGLEVTVGDGLYDHVAQTRPGKYDFYDSGTAEERAEGQTEKGDQREEGIRQDFTPEDVAFREAAGTCAHDVVLMQFFQHRGTDLAGVFRRHDDAQGAHWEDQIFEGNRTADDREEGQLQSEGPKEHKAHPEVRDGDTGEGAAADEIVKPCILLDRGINAERNGEDKHENRRGQRQNDGCRESFHDCVNDRFLHHEGETKITLHDSAKPVQVLQKKRLIQTQFMAECVDFYLTNNNIFITGDHLPHGVTRRKHDQTEGNEADADQDENHLAQSHPKLLH